MRYLPLLLAVIVVASASAIDLLSNYTRGGEAEAWAPVIENGVPIQIGPWVGKDLKDDDKTLITAGAVGKVHRSYTHQETGENVVVWLICGHMQAVARHPPTVCYPSNKYKQQEPKDRYRFEAEGKAGENQFWTTWFMRALPGQPIQRRRVFWAWTLPIAGEEVAWNAPDEARHKYPAARSLFKLYFTTNEPEDYAALSENPSNDLAKRMLPLLTELFKAGPEGYQAVVDAGGNAKSDAGQAEPDSPPQADT